MADKEIIREFLVKLGFQKDDKSLRDFNKGIDEATAKAKNLGLILVGLAATVTAAATTFAKNMEQMYFASKQSGASVTNLKAFENAVQNITGAGDEAVGTLKQLSNLLKFKAGKEGLIASLGVETRDAKGNLRDTLDIVTDLAARFQNMDPRLASQYAEGLNISDGVFRAMIDGSFNSQLARQKQILKDSGFDKAASQSHDFMTSLREIQQEIQIAFLPVMQELVKWMGPALKDAAQWILDNRESIKEFFTSVADAVKWAFTEFQKLDKATGGLSTKIFLLATAFSMLGGPSILGGILALTGAVSGLVTATGGAGLGFLAPFLGRLAGGAGLMAYSSNLNSGEHDYIADAYKNGSLPPSNLSDKQKYLREIEKKYSLPSGFLDNVWNAESARGKAMKSKAGALGHFQFMPSTARQYGLSDPNDFYSSAEAAGHYYSDLAKKYQGNLSKAAAAYNWGPGNVDKRGLGAMPAETKAYVDKVTKGVQIAQETNIYVNGGDAAATGRSVASEQDRVNASLARNFSTAME